MKSFLILCALALPAALHAQTTKSWSGVTGNWSSSNWNPGGTPPTSDDSASIGVFGSVVTLDVDATVASFSFTGGSFRGEVLPAGAPRTLTVNGMVTFSAPSSSIGTGQPMTILANGGLSLASLQNFNGITLTIPSGKSADHDSPSNSGVSNGTVFNNAGTWTAKGSGGLSQTAGTTTFNNSGVFTRNTSALDHYINMAFNNSGTVNANTGRLRLAAGGNATGGSFHVANGAVLEFGGAHTFDAASGIVGLGSGKVHFITTGSATLTNYAVAGATEVQSSTVTFNNGSGSIGATTLSGGTANFNGTASPTALTINSGTATFANNVSLPAGAALNSGTLNIAATKTFTIPGAVTWNGTTLSGGGIFDFNAGAMMTSGASRVDGAVLNLAAGQTVTNSNSGGGVIELRNGAIINNAGLWDNTSFTGFSHTTGTASVFNNSGVFTKRTSSNQLSVNALFNNSGTVNVQIGTMALGSGGTQSGTFNISA